MNAPQPTAMQRAEPAQGITDIEDVKIKSDTRPVIRLGFWVLIVGFGLFMLWAAYAPLDEGVVAPATVAMETHRKVVQHASGGVVKAVMVKEGVDVRQGDVIMVLDDGATRAGLEAVRQNYLGQRAFESRLLAEITAAPAITFHADLLSAKEPTAASHMQVQQQLFRARRAAQVAEITAARQSIIGLEGQIQGQQQMVDTRKGQAALQAQQLANIQQLAADGYAPRNQALDLEQTQAALRAGISELQVSIQRAQSSIAESRLHIAQREQEYIKEASSQLADVRREVGANQERLAAITAELDRTQIRAPVSGQVIGLVINGTGAVVSPGQRLMDIVPHNEKLLLDARVPQPSIDRIKVGDLTQVRFSTFANAPQLVTQGRVLSLSKDAVSEQLANGQVAAYYLARVELTAAGIKALGGHVLQPGMTAEVLIKTGERSLLTYIMHPLTKRVAAAMTEE